MRFDRRSALAGLAGGIALLGLGGCKAGAATGPGFIRRDGTFNVRRIGLSPLRSLSLYHHLLTIAWPRFFLNVAAFYLVFLTALSLIIRYVEHRFDARQA